MTTLVLMLATLGLGVAVMSVGAMEERLIANTKDRDLALQAAEAALRDGEQDIASNVTSATAFNDTCAADCARRRRSAMASMRSLRLLSMIRNSASTGPSAPTYAPTDSTRERRNFLASPSSRDT